MSDTEDTIIDNALGRDGDIDKWKSPKISFVLGIDLYGPTYKLVITTTKIDWKNSLYFHLSKERLLLRF